MKTKKIQIDNNQCSKCGKCVKACLKNVLSQESKKADIKSEIQHNAIYAVLASKFVDEKPSQ